MRTSFYNKTVSSTCLKLARKYNSKYYSSRISNILNRLVILKMWIQVTKTKNFISICNKIINNKKYNRNITIKI